MKKGPTSEEWERTLIEIDRAALFLWGLTQVSDEMMDSRLRHAAKNKQEELEALLDEMHRVN